mmetsp:Transcript_20534/g.57012  ORF Transcript_20534/g.57012 Transcript_20534/m.57012 type:complete len:294 (-) Transcript_20534:185-1066(-)
MSCVARRPSRSLSASTAASSDREPRHEPARPRWADVFDESDADEVFAAVREPRAESAEAAQANHEARSKQAAAVLEPRAARKLAGSPAECIRRTGMGAAPTKLDRGPHAAQERPQIRRGGGAPRREFAGSASAPETKHWRSTRNASWRGYSGQWEQRGCRHGALPCHRAPLDQKKQCQFIVGIEEDADFGVVRRLLGSHGAHVKPIAERTGAKLRLRGRGSKFLEGVERQESTDPLMLCVSAPDVAAYAEAVRLVSERLEAIYAAYHKFCAEAQRPVEALRIQLHEGAREGSY